MEDEIWLRLLNGETSNQIEKDYQIPYLIKKDIEFNQSKVITFKIATDTDENEMLTRMKQDKK